MGFKATLIDLAHRVLSRQTVETQVKNALSLPVRKKDEQDVLEEITEKIKEAVEADPYYSRMFEKSSRKK